MRYPVSIKHPCLSSLFGLQGLVLPGQKVEVTITAYVDDTLASQLNIGQVHLEDTLVLHTALGRDHFVAVSGDYGTTKSSSTRTLNCADGRLQTVRVSPRVSRGLCACQAPSGPCSHRMTFYRRIGALTHRARL